jgi:transposase
LEPYRGQIEAEFKQRPAASMKEAAKRIEQVTGVRRSPDQVRRYLRRLGIKRLKAGQVPAKVNPQAQEDFLKKTLNRA